jgi:hypothetical protein
MASQYATTLKKMHFIVFSKQIAKSYIPNTIKFCPVQSFGQMKMGWFLADQLKIRFIAYASASARLPISSFLVNNLTEKLQPDLAF